MKAYQQTTTLSHQQTTLSHQQTNTLSKMRIVKRRLRIKQWLTLLKFWRIWRGRAYRSAYLLDLLALLCGLWLIVGRRTLDRRLSSLCNSLQRCGWFSAECAKDAQNMLQGIWLLSTAGILWRRTILLSSFCRWAHHHKHSPALMIPTVNSGRATLILDQNNCANSHSLVAALFMWCTSETVLLKRAAFSRWYFLRPPIMTTSKKEQPTTAEPTDQQNRSESELQKAEACQMLEVGAQ